MSEQPPDTGQGGLTVLGVYTRQIRLESQTEQVAAQQETTRGQLTDHEARLRTLETGATGVTNTQKAVQATLADHEKRLRAMETWARALPVSTFVALFAAVASIISAYINP